jgi:hypothetical protein
MKPYTKLEICDLMDAHMPPQAVNPCWKRVRPLMPVYFDEHLPLLCAEDMDVMRLPETVSQMSERFRCTLAYMKYWICVRVAMSISNGFYMCVFEYNGHPPPVDEIVHPAVTDARKLGLPRMPPRLLVDLGAEAISKVTYDCPHLLYLVVSDIQRNYREYDYYGELLRADTKVKAVRVPPPTHPRQLLPRSDDNPTGYACTVPLEWEIAMGLATLRPFVGEESLGKRERNIQ